ncbi:MAG: hypothetical protein JWM68_2084 [Verrucomicrobiales bacterium]|nr:hypothetical protein [Verrucomicrobiales bacterium]
MAIPEHVKRQAMDAVSHRETTQQIRLMDLGPEPRFTWREDLLPEPKPYEPITDDVKRQSMDAISHYETGQIRQLEMTENTEPMYTPSFHSKIIADRVNEMHRQGVQPWQIQSELTKDNFGREL